MPRKYQGGVPRIVDVVNLVRDRRGFSGYWGGAFAPRSWAGPWNGYAAVAGQAHVRHCLLARMDSKDDDAIPAEILFIIFEYLGLALGYRLQGEYPTYFQDIDQLNDFIEEQFSHFPSSRLRRTAFEAFRKTMTFDGGQSCEEDIFDGINANTICRHLDDQVRNIVHLRFPVFLRCIRDLIRERREEGWTLQDFIDTPRFDVAEALTMCRRMSGLRTLTVEIREFVYDSSTDDYKGTRNEVKKLLEGKYAPAFRAFLAGIHPLSVQGVQVSLQVVLYGDAIKTLSWTQVDAGDMVEDLCAALLKPLENGVQHTEDREAYEAEEANRSMSD